ALSAPARPGVRSASRSPEFPLARPLPSTASAAGSSALFGGFPGTSGRSDCPRSSIIGVCPWTSRCGLRPPRPQTNAGSPGSRSRCLGTCAGSLTARGPTTPRLGGAPGMAFRLPPQRRHPEVVHAFRGSIPGPHLPLSTLRGRPHGRPRMTRGRRGSLRLRRMTLSFTAPRRCDRRTEDTMKLKSRTALVTGGSRGIGRAVALALADEGADVAVNYVSSEAAAKDVAEQIRKMGRRAMLAQADVGDFPDTFRMAQEVLKEFGRLDILVNNAG